jgi:hypothetical protein
MAPYFVSRVLSDGLITLMVAVTGGHIVRQGFATWDGRWYTAIARSGYPPYVAHVRQTAWAFFPMLPAAIRVVAALGVPILLGGFVVSHVAFFVALTGMHRLVAGRFSARATNLAVWLVALFPAAIVFSMAYPSAIFLAASVWAFVFVADGHDLSAGTAAVVATLARPNGIVLAIALAFAVGFRSRRLLRVCGPPVLALIGWMAYNALMTGDALTFFWAKHGWREATLADLFARGSTATMIHLSLAGVAVLALVTARRAIPRSWSLFTALYLAPSLVLGIVGLGRYANECFPPFAAGGEILARRDRRFTTSVFVMCVVGQVLFAYWVIALRHIP